MIRQASILTIALSIALASCTKSEDDLGRAERETAGLMPDNDPKFEAEYVADQSQVKLVAARNISYEPLETFRGKSKAKPEGEEATTEEPSAKPSAGAARPTRGAPAGRPQGGAPSGFWSRVGMNALMGGGGAPPGARPPSPGKPAPKGDEPAAKDDEAAEEESADEEASDEEESEEEDSDGE